MGCVDCALFMKEFSLCTSGGVRLVDPEGECLWNMVKSSAESPYKQFTQNQERFIKESDFVFTWDNEGWVTGVSVKGLPSAKPLRALPREAIVFDYFCQRCSGDLVRCRDPSHPGLLVYSPACHDGEFFLYKQWNGGVFRQSDSQRMPAISVPKALSDFIDVAMLVYNRVHERGEAEGRIIEIMPMDNPQQTLAFWKAMGYAGGVMEWRGVSIPYFTYQRGNMRMVVFSGREIEDFSGMVRSMFDGLSFISSDEETVMAGLHLSAKCMGCGHDFGVLWSSVMCPFCLRRITPFRFKKMPFK